MGTAGDRGVDERNADYGGLRGQIDHRGGQHGGVDGHQRPRLGRSGDGPVVTRTHLAHLGVVDHHHRHQVHLTGQLPH